MLDFNKSIEKLEKQTEYQWQQLEKMESQGVTIHDINMLYKEYEKNCYTLNKLICYEIISSYLRYGNDLYDILEQNYPAFKELNINTTEKLRVLVNETRERMGIL